MTDEKKYWVHPWEADAPERIWVWGWRADSVWQEQTWQHEDEPISTMEYVRADLFAALTEQLAAARRDAEEAEAYAAELEDKLKNAVGALRLSRDAINGLTDSGDAFDDICITLAELTGGKDE